MRDFFWSTALLVVMFSCDSKVQPEQGTSTEKEVTIVDGASKYDVYQPSEMSTLMKGMYAYNEQVKQEILAGNELSFEFPEEFLNIHSAQLSETKSRNTTFQSFTDTFINAQKLVFEDSEIPIKERHNNAINMCLACHKSECTGPIPKIRKLLIN